MMIFLLSSQLLNLRPVDQFEVFDRNCDDSSIDDSHCKILSDQFRNEFIAHLLDFFGFRRCLFDISVYRFAHFTNSWKSPNFSIVLVALSTRVS